MSAQPENVSSDLPSPAIDIDIDLDEADLFLQRLTGWDGSRITYQTYDDNKPRGAKKLSKVYHSDGPDRSKQLKALNAAGAAIASCVNETDGKGRAAENIIRIRAIVTHLDKEKLKEPALDIIERCPLRPHIVTVTSDGNYHCFWLVSDLKPSEYAKLMKKVTAYLGADASLSTGPQVAVRVPGFLWQKPGAPPFLSRIHKTEEGGFYGVDSECPYTTAQLDTAFTKGQAVKRPILRDVIPDGKRNGTLFWHHVDLLRFGVDTATATIETTTGNRDHCDPPVSDGELEAVIASAERYVEKHPVKVTPDWLDIIPLPERGDVGEVQPYPLDLLPPAIQQAAKEISRFSMVPAASPAIVGLSALATAIGKKAVVVEREGHEHYPALFFALIAHSGERKSPPFKYMTRPLEQWCADQLDVYKYLALKAKGSNAAVDNEISRIKTVARKKGTDVATVTDQVAAVEAERIPPPVYPTLFTTDTTEERLFQKMYDRNEAFAVMAGEGRVILDAVLGKYSGNGRTGEAIYLAGITRDTITRDRVGGEDGPEEKVMTDPCLNVCLMTQQGKYMELASTPALRDSGALARVWPVWLPTLVGSRIEQKDAPGLNAACLMPFTNLIRAVLDHSTCSCHKVKLSPGAAEERRNFHNEVEQMLGNGEELEDMRDIAGKAVSQTVKLALVLHIAKDHTVLNSPESVIDPSTWAVARTLGVLHLTEAVKVQRMASENPALEAARRILAWIQDEGRVEINTTLLTQSGPRPRLSAAMAWRVLDLLEDHHYLRSTRVEGKRKPVYQVNPLV